MAETLEEYNARMNAAALAEFSARVKPDLGGPTRMPHVSQMLQSKYLVVADIPSPVVATIRAVVPEQFRSRDSSQGKSTKWIMYFAEAQKGLTLNSTIIKVMAAAFGEQSEQWVGKKVRLYVDRTVEFGGRVVGGIRIQPPKTAPTEVGFQTPGAFAPAAFAAGASAFTGAAAPPQGAAFDANTGEIRQPQTATAPGGAVDPEFDDDIPF